MSSWWAKFVILASTVAMVAIRAPHGQRSRTIKVVKTRKGGLETGLLTFATLTFLLPLVWIASPVFSFADYPLRATNFIVGTVGLAVGLWLFYRAHADLGRNWSVTLEIRDKHQLVTGGIYSLVRHPMLLVASCLFSRPGTRVAQLGGRPSLRGRDGFGLRLPPATGRANDARRIRRRIQGLHATNQTPHPAHLVSAR